MFFFSPKRLLLGVPFENRILGLKVKGCSKDLQTLCGGRFVPTEDYGHEKVQRAFAAREPLAVAARPPRAQEWVFFDSALVGVFLFPPKAPLGGSPLKIEFRAWI